MNQALQDLGEYVAAAQGDAVLEFEVAYDQLNITARAESIFKLLTFLRDDQHTRFKQLMDVTAVDFPDRDPRFEVVYNLLSLTLNERIRVKIGIEDDAPVQSVVGVYSSAIWFEREVWDMPVGALIGLVLLVELVLVGGAWTLSPEVGGLAEAPIPPLSEMSNTEAIGNVIYTRYIYLFQAAGVILLIAMIGAIVLTLRQREGVKKQSISRQIARTREESVEIKNVPSGSGV